MSNLFPDESQLLLQLKKWIHTNIHSVAPSWSTAYGLFKQKKVDLVYSYLTSPVYHWVEDKDYKYNSLDLAEPLSVQVELVAIPDRCRECDLAQQFIKFLLSPDAQKIIMNKNYMLPVVEGVVQGTEFEKVKIPQLIPTERYLNWNKKKYLSIWKKALQ